MRDAYHFKGYSKIVLSNVPGATFIPGATSIPESRVVGIGLSSKILALLGF